MSSQPSSRTSFHSPDHAIGSVVSSGADLVPSVIRERGEERDLQHYLAGALEESVAAARQSLREDPVPDRAALARDGFMTTSEGRHEAVFVESYERGTPGGFLVAQGYQRGRIPQEETGISGESWLG